MRIFAFLLSVFLSSISFSAEWGDTFFCEMTHNHYISADGEFTEYHPEPFRFQLKIDKYAMVFGSTGFFKDQKFELHPETTFLGNEWWT